MNIERYLQLSDVRVYQIWVLSYNHSDHDINKSLQSDHCLQVEAQNGLDNLYIPTSSLAICFSVLEDSGPSACRDLLTHGATRLLSACCFLQSTYTHNAFHLRLHILR